MSLSWFVGTQCAENITANDEQLMRESTYYQLLRVGHVYYRKCQLIGHLNEGSILTETHHRSIYCRTIHDDSFRHGKKNVRFDSTKLAGL